MSKKHPEITWAVQIHFDEIETLSSIVYAPDAGDYIRFDIQIDKFGGKKQKTWVFRLIALKSKTQGARDKIVSENNQIL